MAGIKGMNRKIPIDKVEGKRLKKEILPLTKNKTESKRVNIMIVYLNGNNVDEVGNNLGVSVGTVLKTINSYKENKETFYQTKRKGKIETDEWKKATERVLKILYEFNDNGKEIDLYSLGKEYNRRHKKSKILKYDQIWYIIRRKCKFGYQKPYIKDKRQPKKAKIILKKGIQDGFETILNNEGIEITRLKNKKIPNQANTA